MPATLRSKSPTIQRAVFNALPGFQASNIRKSGLYHVTRGEISDVLAAGNVSVRFMQRPTVEAFLEAFPEGFQLADRRSAS